MCLTATCLPPCHMWCGHVTAALCYQPVCPHQVGILFDVDGVLLRGGSVIPAARWAFRKLVDQNNNFLFPVVFVTNAGSCQRHYKAQQLSHLLEIQVGQSGGGWVNGLILYLPCTAGTEFQWFCSACHRIHSLVTSLALDCPGAGGSFPQSFADVEEFPW